ncbi:hypothetical protein CVIRNUC_001501 [Coccomyxa viridis]|uniref:Uncharacterized protein n=1 Tax=Coccomyxa viridis TaxID=1274662 RepID=A0AAV1HUP5_9CHLO|nr:hypothetical protein CVIRNUC_001501 [Coccomyxa viridis]
MTPTAELAIARANAFVAPARAKAVSASRLLAYVVLRYGVQVARRIAEQFSKFVRRAVLRLQMAYQCLQRPQQFQQQVRLLLADWTATPPVALSGQALRLAAKYVLTISIRRSIEVPGTTDRSTGLCIRLLGGLAWIQMGARRPHLPELQWFRRGNNAALPSSAQPETPVEAELQSSPVQKRERAEPGALLTSSTESFRSGLTGYAQLQASRATSPQKAVKATSERRRRIRQDSIDAIFGDVNTADSRPSAKPESLVSGTPPTTEEAAPSGHRNSSVWGASRILAPSARTVSPAESAPLLSGVKRAVRSKGAGVAASLDTGTVLRDLLQTVAPETPDSITSSSSSSETSAKAAGLRASLTSSGAASLKENTGPWR